jgi:hypothetical protein
MHTHQGKSALGMSFQNILSILPVYGGMTIPALDPELGPMNVRMAIRAFYPDMGKLEFFMTVSAVGILMGSGKRKTCCGMRKTGGFPDKIPSLGGMAGVAIPGNIAVGTFPGAKIDKNNH